MTTSENTTQDPRPLLSAAMDQAGDLIAGTDPADGNKPTPCDEYDVATLINHLQAVVRRIDAVVSGQPFFSVPQKVESTDWESDWKAGRAATDAALAKADLSTIVQVPWGEVPIGAAIGSYIGEFAIHSWDLASATGRAGQLDHQLAAAILPAYIDNVPAEPRGGEIPFGPVVEVGSQAPAYEKLVAWSGRNPNWRATG